ncbi:MAG TPA: 2-oxo-4-hydroxy-4-carboxy-5-ureidoimidazoline decarboxylase [Vicinamibacteria bacterium]|nr:2-oxo-4-hydroxy-4-carboxy-5-ureidoimidazoline decarboxylase [Vicinamibacteria bacterium]
MGASSETGLRRLNALPEAEAQAALLRCCGSSRWAEAMTGARPFASGDALLAAAERAFAQLEPGDWMEAFSHHPRIGDRAALEARLAATRAWSAGEQAGVAAAAPDVLDALAAGNRAYEERFGHVFLVCATGKSAGEMLALLHERLPNPPARELRVAAAEQAKITRLRLEKMLQEVNA